MPLANSADTNPAFAAAPPPRVVDSTLRQTALAGVTVPDIALGELIRGNSATLVHFWAEWCAPCRKELSELLRFYSGGFRKLESSGLGLITINHDPEFGDAQAAAEEFGMQRVPVFHDPYFRIHELLGGAHGLLPFTSLLLADGRVVPLRVGPLDWQSEQLTERLRAYLVEAP